MSDRIPADGYRLWEFHPAGPARSACGGPAPTSVRRAHSPPAAGPSDPALDPYAVGEHGLPQN